MAERRAALQLRRVENVAHIVERRRNVAPGGDGAPRIGEEEGLAERQRRPKHADRGDLLLQPRDNVAVGAVEPVLALSSCLPMRLQCSLIICSMDLNTVKYACCTLARARSASHDSGPVGIVAGCACKMNGTTSRLCRLDDRAAPFRAFIHSISASRRYAFTGEMAISRGRLALRWILYSEYSDMR